VFHETSIDEPGVSLHTVRGTQPSCLEYSIGDSSELTSDVLHTSKLDDAAANSREIDFALVLARTIDSIKDDPSLLRNMVYELARSKLLTLAWEQKPRIRTLEVSRLLLSFETAVQHVERHASREDELRTPGSVPGLVSSAHFAKEIDRGDSILIVDQTMRPTEALKAKKSYSEGVSHARKRDWRRAAVVFRATCVVIAVGMACAIGGKYLVPSRHAASVVHASASVLPKSGSQKEPVSTAQFPNQGRRAGLPLPNVYGVYAVSNGVLHDLEALPGRVPDPRVFMSTPVKTPSKTILPDGRLAFIVFRRDLSSAPDRVSVRAIAKVVRGMSFDSDARANVSNLDDQWAIRSASFELRVTPVDDNPEMLLLRPENPEFVFPAGRYGVVLKGQAFDFSVAGPITEPVQCLERVAAANGNFYSECRSR
jgi:hypothetical protein